MGYKIRESQMQKIPYTLVLGDKEKDNNSVNYRTYNSNESIELNIDEFITKLKEEIKNKKINIDK
jgi:threonyl-tRNA synthetase